MKSLTAALADRKADIARQAANVKTLSRAVKATNLARAFDRLVAHCPQAELMVYSYSVYIDVPVKSMQHMTDALEFFENELGVEFTSTKDEPTGGVRRMVDDGLSAWSVLNRIQENVMQGGWHTKSMFTGRKSSVRAVEAIGPVAKINAGLWTKTEELCHG